jgi:hypothetical protein
VNTELGAREVNKVKAVSDNDKANILNFNASLALASPHCKINWPICSNVVLPSFPLNLKKLRNSIASRVRKLIVVVKIWLLVNTPLVFRFCAEGLTQDSSQLVG